ncbi:PREDICTED: uncharacterized protein LOC105360816 [Ceratosolen solmsi marchali]|uniref:Uncharacterized protein LOC105360816 n=1 Tax=Ceratosolen solmsi marchali TaxID=326594 RepID=A0AAJ6YDL8_9HYME|nr:PREDICTED: uncharacterized protein LOC105360816 [Ceratosolen solmsi marchali]
MHSHMHVNKQFHITPQTSLCLGLIANGAANPPLFLSYQDSIGQYSFGYSGPMSARSEYRSSDGVTRGTYSYIDRNGLIQTAEYEAGNDLGFRIKATNLPEAPHPVQDTPEVKAARDKHLELLEEAKRRVEATAKSNVGPSLPRIRSNAQMPLFQLRVPNAVHVDYQSGKLMPQGKNAASVEHLQHDDRSIELPAKIIFHSNIGPETSAPSSPTIQSEPIQYTPEVTAARKAHFRFYDTAAKLATLTDSDPNVLMQLYRNQADRSKTSMLMQIDIKDQLNLIDSNGNSFINVLANVTNNWKDEVDKLQVIHLITTRDKSKHALGKLLCTGVE